MKSPLKSVARSSWLVKENVLLPAPLALGLTEASLVDLRCIPLHRIRRICGDKESESKEKGARRRVGGYAEILS